MYHLVPVALAFDHWIFHPLVGRGYQFWSGIAGCFGVLGILWAYLRKHNCHAKRCWRLGRHQVEGTDYITCRRHHPDDKPSVEHIHKVHHERKSSIPQTATRNPATKKTTTRSKKHVEGN